MTSLYPMATTSEWSAEVHVNSNDLIVLPDSVLVKAKRGNYEGALTLTAFYCKENSLIVEPFGEDTLKFVPLNNIDKATVVEFSTSSSEGCKQESRCQQVVKGWKYQSNEGPCKQAKNFLSIPENSTNADDDNTIYAVLCINKAKFEKERKDYCHIKVILEATLFDDSSKVHVVAETPLLQVTTKLQPSPIKLPTDMPENPLLSSTSDDARYTGIVSNLLQDVVPPTTPAKKMIMLSEVLTTEITQAEKAKNLTRVKDLKIIQAEITMLERAAIDPSTRTWFISAITVEYLNTYPEARLSVMYHVKDGWTCIVYKDDSIHWPNRVMVIQPDWFDMSKYKKLTFEYTTPTPSTLPQVSRSSPIVYRIVNVEELVKTYDQLKMSYHQLQCEYMMLQLQVAEDNARQAPQQPAGVISNELPLSMLIRQAAAEVTVEGVTNATLSAVNLPLLNDTVNNVINYFPVADNDVVNLESNKTLVESDNAAFFRSQATRTFLIKTAASASAVVTAVTVENEKMQEEYVVSTNVTNTDDDGEGEMDVSEEPWSSNEGSSPASSSALSSFATSSDSSALTAIGYEQYSFAEADDSSMQDDIATSSNAGTTTAETIAYNQPVNPLPCRNEKTPFAFMDNAFTSNSIDPDAKKSYRPLGYLQVKTFITLIPYKHNKQQLTAVSSFIPPSSLAFGEKDAEDFGACIRQLSEDGTMAVDGEEEEHRFVTCRSTAANKGTKKKQRGVVPDDAKVIRAKAATKAKPKATTRKRKRVVPEVDFDDDDNNSLMMSPQAVDLSWVDQWPGLNYGHQSDRLDFDLSMEDDHFSNVEMFAPAAAQQG